MLPFRDAVLAIDEFLVDRGAQPIVNFLSNYEITNTRVASVCCAVSVLPNIFMMFHNALTMPFSSALTIGVIVGVEMLFAAVYVRAFHILGSISQSVYLRPIGFSRFRFIRMLMLFWLTFDTSTNIIRFCLIAQSISAQFVTDWWFNALSVAALYLGSTRGRPPGTHRRKAPAGATERS